MAEKLFFAPILENPRENRSRSFLPVIAIVGYTNAGKSTLLNVLLGEEKAIVSDIHGTTRDVIEDTINLSGHLFRFIDTAGIRQTTDTIESLGIARSFKALDEAEIVILMCDLSRPTKDFQNFLFHVILRFRSLNLF